AEAVEPAERTALFARYNLAGNLAGALGSLASALPGKIGASLGFGDLAGERAAFAAYGLGAAAPFAPYRPAPVRPPRPGRGARGGAARPLARSRRTVLGLAALFSLDSFGGGFAVQSLLALWLFQRFDLSLAEAGAVFFAANLLAGFSQLASPWIAARIGLVRATVFTHL